MQVKFFFTDREPVEVTIFETMEIRRGTVTQADIIMPEIPGYKAGRLVRLDSSWEVQPAAMIDKAIGMTGFESTSFQYAFLMILLQQYIASPVQLDEWHTILGSDIKAMLHPDFFEENYGGNAEIIRLVKAIAANSVTGFPEPGNVAKIKLYHSKSDDTVPFVCSEHLRDAWPNLSEITILNAKDSHMKCGVEFLLDYCGLSNLAALL